MLPVCLTYCMPHFIKLEASEVKFTWFYIEPSSAAETWTSNPSLPWVGCAAPFPCTNPPPFPSLSFPTASRMTVLANLALVAKDNKPNAVGSYTQVQHRLSKADNILKPQYHRFLI